MLSFGLIGYPLAHSFSQKYFSQKFADEGIDAQYGLYELTDLCHFTTLLANNNFCGLNVTIPYKERIIPYLDELDDTAKQIGAVNVIKITSQNGRRHLKGYNSDAIGFANSIAPYLKPWHKQALVLGTGGAAKAVCYALSKMGVVCTCVSRTPKAGQLAYSALTAEVMAAHTLLVNATPLGTFPAVDACPAIPYEAITSQHLLFDVVYNPEKTVFLQRGEQQGAQILNGLGMLRGQAVAAWKKWTE